MCRRMRCGWEEGGRELVTGGVFVFGGFVGVPLFFFFFFFSGEREKGGFFFLQVPSTTRIPNSSSHRPFSFLFKTLSTDDPPSKKDISKTQKGKKKEKKTHPNIGPPVPKNKLKLPTFIHVGKFSHPT